MPYTLEIHHIEIGLGDSTLVTVIDETTNQLTTSVLIDGGLESASAIVDTYVRNQNVIGLDAMVASHYDKDHYWGLVDLLADQSSMLCDNLDIYDRGEQGNVNQAGNVTGGRDNKYITYVTQIARVNTRRRQTGNVIVNRTGNLPNAWNGAAWLLERTVFNLNGGNTKMVCLTANKWVVGANNLNFVQGTLSNDDNPFSLGFGIVHNNFRYFTAGDLTIPQEEEAARFMNQANNNNGHVCAIKANHHGANTSSSAVYLARLRPRAVFISAGFGNGYGHPAFQALTNIENAPGIQYYYLTSCGSQQSSAVLIGCNQHLDQIATNSMARVAGSRPHGIQPANRGDIVLRVTDAQSRLSPHHQFSVSYYDQDNNGLYTITHNC